MRGKRREMRGKIYMRNKSKRPAIIIFSTHFLTFRSPLSQAQNLKKIVLIRSKKIHWLKNFLDKNDHYIYVESLMDDMSYVHSNESCAIHSRNKFILFELMVVYDSLSCHNLYSFMHQLFFLDMKF